MKPSPSHTESPRPFHCVGPACSHLFGEIVGNELRIRGPVVVDVILRSRAVLTCPKCGEKTSWRPRFHKSPHLSGAQAVGAHTARGYQSFPLDLEEYPDRKPKS